MAHIYFEHKDAPFSNWGTGGNMEGGHGGGIWKKHCLFPPSPSLSHTSNNTQNIIYALFTHCLCVIWCIFTFIFSVKFTCLKSK